MWVSQLYIKGFRAIEEATIPFDKRTVLIGPNGCGKTTIIDALSLVLGRDKMVATLTEHDFTGCTPSPSDRIHIVASVIGFEEDNPDHYPGWFRPGAAVERWLGDDGSISPARRDKNDRLCARIGFAARFDHESLEVDRLRYFPDDASLPDPFADERIQTVPRGVLAALGFYVLPARRDRDHVLSFASTLFRAAVAKGGGVPAESVLRERDRVRSPAEPIETLEPLAALTGRLDKQLARLDPSAPSFQLRLTNTDSDAVLGAMVPHYRVESGASLPASRHGSGLISLQTLLLLGEIGRDRVKNGQGFILAVEEPELHVPPGSQRRVIQEAARDADQVICTTHSPRVASFFQAHEVRITEFRSGHVAARPLVAAKLAPSSPNQLRKLFVDLRPGVVEALMYPFVLIPEGRLDQSWLRLFVDAVETSPAGAFSSFGSFVGVAPTTDEGPPLVHHHLAKTRGRLATLVDGDKAGRDYVKKLLANDPPPSAVMIWQDDWSIEDVVVWILRGDETASVAGLAEILDTPPTDLLEFRGALGKKSKDGGIKEHYLLHEEIAGLIGRSPACVARVTEVLDALLAGITGSEHAAVQRTDSTPEVRIVLT